MAAPASICFPTRRRREYLAVALASVAPQAAACGAELVIVEDAAADAETAALADRHGATYLALGSERGINVARNAAVDASSGATRLPARRRRRGVAGLARRVARRRGRAA